MREHRRVHARSLAQERAGVRLGHVQEREDLRRAALAQRRRGAADGGVGIGGGEAAGVLARGGDREQPDPLTSRLDEPRPGERVRPVGRGEVRGQEGHASGGRLAREPRRAEREIALPDRERGVAHAPHRGEHEPRARLAGGYLRRRDRRGVEQRVACVYEQRRRVAPGRLHRDRSTGKTARGVRASATGADLPVPVAGEEQLEPPSLRGGAIGVGAGGCDREERGDEDSHDDKA